MSIEQSIDKLTTALENYTVVLEKSIEVFAAGKGAASTEKAAEEKPAEKKTPAKKAAPAKKKAAAKKDDGPTLDDVKAITMQAVNDAELEDEVRAIVKTYGKKKATELDEGDYAEYIEKVQALIDGADGDDDDEDDDDDDIL